MVKIVDFNEPHSSERHESSGSPFKPGTSNETIYSSLGSNVVTPSFDTPVSLNSSQRKRPNVSQAQEPTFGLRQSRSINSSAAGVPSKFTEYNEPKTNKACEVQLKQPKLLLSGNCYGMLLF